MCEIWPLSFCCRHVHNMNMKSEALARKNKAHLKQWLRGGTSSIHIKLPMEKWTLCPTLAINDTIITWDFLHGVIDRAHIRLSFKPAGRDLVCCLKTLQQGSKRPEPKFSGWMIILCYKHCDWSLTNQHRWWHNSRPVYKRSLGVTRI